MIKKTIEFRKLNKTSAAVILATLSITACSTSNDTESDKKGNGEASLGLTAFAATGSFPAGQIERISIANGYTVDATYPATGSDILVETDGKSVFQIGRYNLNSITKFDPTDTSLVDYQYSVIGEELSANPSDLVFVSDTKAYMPRYDSPTVWIVNPAATSEEEFKIGELDLSAYDADASDTDLSPKATSAVVVDGKLFVLMQRLSGQYGAEPRSKAYVAVFDVATDTEINTATGETAGLKGIRIDTLNPSNIRYNEATDEIYLTGRGNLYNQDNTVEGDPYQGGLFAIDPNTYTVAKYLDDGEQSTNNDLGFISKTLVINDTKGYVLFYRGYDPVTFIDDDSFHTFNPSTGEIGETVSALDGQTIKNFTLGSDGFVWVGVGGDTPGFVRLDTATDTTVEPFVQTSFAPINVVFMGSANP